MPMLQNYLNFHPTTKNTVKIPNRFTNFVLFTSETKSTLMHRIYSLLISSML
jgi:hypothetical protein